MAKIYNIIVGPFDTKLEADRLFKKLKTEGYKANRIVESEVVLGDIDGDGEVTSADARLASRAMVGLEKLTKEEIARGDINKNGEIDPEDARAILRKSVGLDK